VFELNSFLVPIDFSPAARAAFDQAVALASGEESLVIALHVIDLSLVDFAVAHQLASRDDVLRTMRAQAEREMAAYKQPQRESVDVQTIVCEGTPFFEIIKKADEFQVDAIVMGKFGAGGRREVKLLFGTTAERVIRASTRAVLVLPMRP
jgi:nucleotide-binding universal stress UspA family protein